MKTEGTVRAAEIMVRDVTTVSPTWSALDLEGAFGKFRVSGFPVVDGHTLVGVVSRSDVVRQLTLERSRAGQISDYFRSQDSGLEEEMSSLLQEEHFVAGRMKDLRVADLMSPATFVVTPEMPVHEVATVLHEHRIHRVPVVDGNALVGIISSLDLIRLIANRRLTQTA